MASSRARSTLWKRGGVLAAAVAVHVVLLGLMAFPALESLSGVADEPAAVTVSIEPFLVPVPHKAAERAGPAAPSAYAPRMAARLPRLSTAVPIPGVAAPPTRAAEIGAGAHPAPLPAGPTGDLRAALRGSGVGCANADAVGLTRPERDRCHERWGEASRAAPIYANVPASARAGQEFARQALQQEIARAYRAAPMASGLDPGNSPPGMRAVPQVLGAEQDGLGRPMDAAHQELKHLEDAMKPRR